MANGMRASAKSAGSEGTWPEMSVFKACDVRGRYGSEVTPELAERLGRAVGTEADGPLWWEGTCAPARAR
jgi:phosphomannomutase